MMIKFKLGELFCGPGGLGLGVSLVKNAKVEHTWATDYDRDSCNSYK
jgi:DNA (cytosine-5)-methyltransferase 1